MTTPNKIIGISLASLILLSISYILFKSTSSRGSGSSKKRNQGTADSLASNQAQSVQEVTKNDIHSTRSAIPAPAALNLIFETSVDEEAARLLQKFSKLDDSSSQKLKSSNTVLETSKALPVIVADIIIPTTEPAPPSFSSNLLDILSFEDSNCFYKQNGYLKYHDCQISISHLNILERKLDTIILDKKNQNLTETKEFQIDSELSNTNLAEPLADHDITPSAHNSDPDYEKIEFDEEVNHNAEISMEFLTNSLIEGDKEQCENNYSVDFDAGQEESVDCNSDDVNSTLVDGENGLDSSVFLIKNLLEDESQKIVANTVLTCPSDLNHRSLSPTSSSVDGSSPRPSRFDPLSLNEIYEKSDHLDQLVYTGKSLSQTTAFTTFVPQKVDLIKKPESQSTQGQKSSLVTNKQVMNVDAIEFVPRFNTPNLSNRGRYVLIRCRSTYNR